VITRKSSGGGGGGGATNALKVAKGRWDFADGGASGSSHQTGCIIPSGAIIANVIVYCETALTRAPGDDPPRVSLTLESDGDLTSQAVYNSSPWYTYPYSLQATKRTTAERNITVSVDNIAEFGVTGGILNIYVLYFLPASL
jgi:hypothetical protein